MSPIVYQISKSIVSGNGPPFVADQQALNEKLLGVFFLDGYRNVVRHSAIDPNGLGDMKVWQEFGRVVRCWSNGKIDLLYKRQGKLGTRYYP